jgi:hypothetical protein
MLTPEREAEFFCELRPDDRVWTCARKEMQAEIDRQRDSETETVAALSMARAEIDRLRGERLAFGKEMTDAAMQASEALLAMTIARDEARAEVERLTARSVQEGKARRLGVKFATIDAVARAERLAAALREISEFGMSRPTHEWEPVISADAVVLAREALRQHEEGK